MKGFFMKYMNQCFFIMLFSCLGEALRWLLPFPIPASIYGLVLLFFALCTGMVRLESLENAADFFIDMMPFFFVPAGVKLLVSWGELRPVLLPVIVIIVVSTVVVMAVSGCVTQAVLRKQEKHKKRNL